MLKRALQLLAFFADGCHCKVDMRCSPCQSRDLLKEAGWKQNLTNGYWYDPSPNDDKG